MLGTLLSSTLAICSIGALFALTQAVPATRFFFVEHHRRQTIRKEVQKEFLDKLATAVSAKNLSNLHKKQLEALIDITYTPKGANILTRILILTRHMLMYNSVENRNKIDTILAIRDDKYADIAALSLVLIATRAGWWREQTLRLAVGMLQDEAKKSGGPDILSSRFHHYLGA